MGRQYLEAGYRLAFDNDTFEIEQAVGAGANCVVYEAVRTKNGYRYKYYLKECYPYDASITRNADGYLEWADTAEKEQKLKKFRDAYNILLNIYNDKSLRNSTSVPMDLFEANGTAYFLNDIKTGMTFEEYPTKSLSDILSTAIALSRLMEKYHKAGYLHLDIKPENIFLLDETCELPVLFDVDSVVSIEMLNAGEIRHISFSEEYAAPEQKKEKLSEINERTDIYNLGATIFTKIMGRFVNSLDRGIFADWKLDEIPMFKNVNPHTQKYIKDIFRKTLAVQNKNRYENMAELTEALTEAKNACDTHIYLTSDYPAVVKNFIGRESELCQIRNAFEYNNIIFLYGFGGIGKSELAKKYAHNYKDDYDTILFCRYTESLKNTLYLIPCGQETDIITKHSFSNKEKILKNLLNERVLLIIDNFDVDVAEDDYLCELSEYNAKIIITTRTDFSACALEGFEVINVSTIEKDTLRELFVVESGYGEISSEDSFLIDKILAAYKYHTLFVKPLAYKIKHLGYTVKALKEEVDSALLEDIDLVVGVHDNKLYEETIKTLAERLFNIEQLDSEKQQILCDLYMLGEAKISTTNYIDEVYKDLSQNEKKQLRNKLINLIRVGLIQKNELTETLEIHPVIAEIINKNLNPDISKCGQLSIFVYNKAVRLVNDIGSYVYGDEADMSLEKLCSICYKMDLKIKTNRDYIINLMFDVCKNRRYDWIISLFNDIFEQMPDNCDNIKLQYLKFLTIIYPKAIFTDPDEVAQPQTISEEMAVNFIYSFYKECNDGSELFTAIFWKMILNYSTMLDSLSDWGWNMSLYEKINECIINEESSGRTLHNYVFETGDEHLGCAYMNEDGEWIDDNQMVRTPQLIREIYQENHNIVSSYNIDTNNKNSFEIYNECKNIIPGCYRTKLDSYQKKCKQSLSPSEHEEIKDILFNVRTNPLLCDFKDNFMECYIELFAFVDSDLEYEILIEAEKANMKEVLGKILSDKKISESNRNKYLYLCIHRIIIRSNGDYTSYETQAKVLECISDYTEQLIAYSIDNPDPNGVLDNMLLAYLVADYDSFAEITNRVLKGSLSKIYEEIKSGKHLVSALTFREFIPMISFDGNCHLFYPFLCEYVDSLCDLYKREEVIVSNLEYTVENCIRCAKLAYSETNDKKYRLAYKEYKKRLKLIKDIEY